MDKCDFCQSSDLVLMYNVNTSRIGANLTWNYRGKILSDVDFENDIGFFVDQYQINDTIQYDRSQSGLGYNFSSKFINNFILQKII